MTRLPIATAVVFVAIVFIHSGLCAHIGDHGEITTKADSILDNRHVNTTGNLGGANITHDTSVLFSTVASSGDVRNEESNSDREEEGGIAAEEDGDGDKENGGDLQLESENNKNISVAAVIGNKNANESLSSNDNHGDERREESSVAGHVNDDVIQVHGEEKQKEIRETYRAYKVYDNFFDDFYDIGRDEKKKNTEREGRFSGLKVAVNRDPKAVVYDNDFYDEFYGIKRVNEIKEGEDMTKIKEGSKKMEGTDGGIDAVWKETVDSMIEELSNFLEKNNPCILMKSRIGNDTKDSKSSGSGRGKRSGDGSRCETEVAEDGGGNDNGIVVDLDDLRTGVLREMEDKINGVFEFCEKSCGQTNRSSDDDSNNGIDAAKINSASSASEKSGIKHLKNDTNSSTTTVTTTNNNNDDTNNNRANININKYNADVEATTPTLTTTAAHQSAPRKYNNGNNHSQPRPHLLLSHPLHNNNKIVIDNDNDDDDDDDKNRQRPSSTSTSPPPPPSHPSLEHDGTGKGDDANYRKQAVNKKTECQKCCDHDDPKTQAGESHTSNTNNNNKNCPQINQPHQPQQQHRGHHEPVDGCQNKHGEADGKKDEDFPSCYNSQVSQSSCIDIFSQESVVSQLCTKMTSLDKGHKCVTSQLLSNQRARDETVSELQNQIADLKRTVELLQRSAMFYAEAPFGSSQVRGYKVKVTDGQDFEPVSGLFTAPYDGAYQITVGYFRQGISNTHDLINVLIDHQVIFRLHVDRNGEQRMFMTSLKTGQTVHLKTNVDYSNETGDGLNHDLVQFGAVLVK